jgi:hypothetical protein
MAMMQQINAKNVKLDASNVIEVYLIAHLVKVNQEMIILSQSIKILA